MIRVPAHKVQQFGVEFYQATFSARDIDRLVRFEVLSYTGGPEPPQRKRRPDAFGINWELLERRIAHSEAAFQRPLIRRKIQELLQYYKNCQEAQNLPAIPGAVIMITDRRLVFQTSGAGGWIGQLQIPEEPGILRALDGQHRLLALHAASTGDGMDLHVPAVVFDCLDARQVVELFVTINAKHTRLNPSHLLGLAGRRLYSDRQQALAHDIIRKLNTGAAVRAFIRVAPDVMERAREIGRDAFDAHAIRRAIAPWGERLGDRRFETEGEWKRRLAGGTRSTVELLARELRDALRR